MEVRVMKDERIEELINRLNTGEDPGCSLLRPISERVDYGTIWRSKPDGSRDTSYGARFFAIRDASGEYIAAVHDMDGEHDLHAFVKSEHRRKSVMSRALTDVILPYLKSVGRHSQPVTIDGTAGLELAKKVGFSISKDSMSATIDLSQFADVEFPEWEPRALEEDRRKEIDSEIRMASQILKRVADEVEFTFATDWPLASTIRELADEVVDVRLQVQDEVLDQEAEYAQ